ncbi:hypothetical protein MG293_005375 [Ovis ammon polii]|uniref:Uncharacterized protein n=1 Tax=Ovis ammon polii TaxID=230172 RepID=A0AAD4YEK5_OVIAM|nr:hypothetical protein MG293_005375 [Ovis ammon polii]
MLQLAHSANLEAAPAHPHPEGNQFGSRRIPKRRRFTWFRLPQTLRPALLPDVPLRRGMRVCSVGHSVPYGEVYIWRSSGCCRAHEGAIGGRLGSCAACLHAVEFTWSADLHALVRLLAAETYVRKQFPGMMRNETVVLEGKVWKNSDIAYAIPKRYIKWDIGNMDF